MNTLDELLKLLRKRSKQFEREAKMALTDELEIIYRAKAAEAYSIYVIIENMKKKMIKEGKEDANEV